MVRVRSEADAERLRHELRHDGHHGHDRHGGHGGRHGHAEEFAPLSGAGHAGVAADGSGVVELDPGEFAAADAELARRYDEVAGYLRQAMELEGPLADGASPVTAPMRTAFGQRAGATEGGVQAALRGYLDELATLRETLRRVSAAHQQQDEEAAMTMRARQANAGPTG